MNSTARIIFLSVLTVILFGVLGYSQIWISGAKERAAEALARADALSGNDSFTRSVRNLQSSATAEIATIQDAAIVRNDLIALIESLEESGEIMDLEVSIASITTDPVQATTTPQTVQMVVDAKGSWQSNLSFIKILQSLPVKAEIENASLSFSNGSWRSGATLKITIFPENNL